MAIKNSERAAFWQQHLDNFRASGLSRGAYSREHGLKIHQLGYQLDRRSKTKAASTGAFARVVAAEPSARVETKSVAARLCFGTDVALEVDAGTDPAWVARLIAHIGGRP